MDKESRIKIIINIIPIVLFLLLDSPIIRSILTVIYILTAIIYGKKVKPVPNIVLVISITLISQFSPLGQVLYRVGPLYITKGAILEGIRNSSLLIGMIYLSKSMNLSYIKLGGRIGSIIQKTFYYLERFTSKERVDLKNIAESLDNLLLNIERSPEGSDDLINSSKSFHTYTVLIVTLVFFTLDILNVTS